MPQLEQRRLSSASSIGNVSFILGIDLGTTSVKVCLVNADNQMTSDLHVKDALAYVPSDCGNVGDQQDPSRIYSALHACLARIPRERLKKVIRIALSGQMHGVIFWKGDNAWTVQQSDNRGDRFEIGEGISSLYTWQDSRCDQEFMKSLPAQDSHLKLATGYGCATIFWFQRHRPDFLAKYDCCGTLMDFIVAMITNNQSKPSMSNHNASSWGYFNSVTNEWNLEILEKEKFPTSLLPKVVMPATDVGTLQDKWFEIAAGTPVSVALGDLQCSVMSTLEDAEKDVVMNISTSAQMAFVMPAGFAPEKMLETGNSVIEYLPYLDGHYIATAASLTGGNAIAAFVKMIQRWVVDLGLSIPQSKIWEKTIALGSAEQDASPSSPTKKLESVDSKENSGLMEIIPRLYGERHLPDERASATNICAGNLSLGQVTRSVCHGVVRNMAEMMPPEVIHDAGMKRIIGSGAGLCRNPILKSQVQEIYKLPVEFAAEANACIGCALAVIDMPNPKNSNSTSTLNLCPK